jgi:hypothetical protein
MRGRRMNPNDLETLVLERARAAMVPSPSSRRDALAGIAAGLSLPPPALPGGVGTFGTAGGSAAVKAGSAVGGFSLKALVVGVVAASAVGTGAYMTISSPGTAVPPRVAASAVALPSPGAAGVDPGHRGSLPELPRARETRPPEVGALRAAEVGAESARAAASPTPSASRGLAQRDPTPDEVEPVTPPVGHAGETRGGPLELRELAALREAQSALARDDGATALALMRRLDETDPGGVLSAERAVTQVLALCRLGRTTEATTVARQALRDGQGTALYRGRLAASCARIDDDE